MHLKSTEDFFCFNRVCKFVLIFNRKIDFWCFIVLQACLLKHQTYKILLL